MESVSSCPVGPHPRASSLALHLAVVIGAITTLAILGELVWKFRTQWSHAVQGALVELAAYAGLYAILRLLVARLWLIWRTSSTVWPPAASMPVQVVARAAELTSRRDAHGLAGRAPRGARRAQRAVRDRAGPRPREASEALERITRLGRALGAPRAQTAAHEGSRLLEDALRRPRRR